MVQDGGSEAEVCFGSGAGVNVTDIRLHFVPEMDRPGVKHPARWHFAVEWWDGPDEELSVFSHMSGGSATRERCAEQLLLFLVREIAKRPEETRELLIGPDPQFQAVDGRSG